MTTGSSPTQPGSRVGALKYQTAHGFRRGQPVYCAPTVGGGKYTLATEATGFDGVIGSIPSANQFELVTAGQLDNIASLLTAGPSLYLSSTAGAYAKTGNTLVFKAQSTDKATVQPAHAGTVATSAQTSTITTTGFTSASNSGSGAGVFNPATSTTSTLKFKTLTVSGAAVLTDNGSSLDLGVVIPPTPPAGIDAQLAYDTAILAEASLVGFWKCNDPVGSATLADSKGVNPLTISGALTLGRQGPIPGTGSGCIIDPGASPYASTSSYVGLPTGNVPFTLEAWFRCYNGGASPGVIAIGSSPIVAMTVFGSNFGTYVGGYGAILSIPDAHGDDGNYHHGVLSYDGTNFLTLYFDGLPVGSYAFGTLSVGVVINLCTVGGGSILNGAVSRAACYSTALSPDRILAHYNTAKLGFAP